MPRLLAPPKGTTRQKNVGDQFALNPPYCGHSEYSRRVFDHEHSLEGRSDHNGRKRYSFNDSRVPSFLDGTSICFMTTCEPSCGQRDAEKATSLAPVKIAVFHKTFY